MGGPPGRGQRAPAPALVGDDNVGDSGSGVAGRALADHCVIEPLVGGRAVEIRSDALAVGLLADERRKLEFCVWVGVAERQQRRRDGALHVGGPTAVESAVTFLDVVATVPSDL